VNAHEIPGTGPGATNGTMVSKIDQWWRSRIPDHCGSGLLDDVDYSGGAT
jgi:hypothetical protein